MFAPRTVFNVFKRSLQGPAGQVTENKQQSIAHRCRPRLPDPEIRKEILGRFERPAAQSIRTIRTRMKKKGVDEFQIEETLRAELDSRPRGNRHALSIRERGAA